MRKPIRNLGLEFDGGFVCLYTQFFIALFLPRPTRHDRAGPWVEISSEIDVASFANTAKTQVINVARKPNFTNKCGVDSFNSMLIASLCFCFCVCIFLCGREWITASAGSNATSHTQAALQFMGEWSCSSRQRVCELRLVNRGQMGTHRLKNRFLSQIFLMIRKDIEYRWSKRYWRILKKY